MSQTSEFELAEPTAPSSNHAPTPRQQPAVVIQLQDHKAAGGAPRANKQIKWIRLSETNEEYANHEIQARIRYPEQFNAEYFAPGSPSSILEGLRLVVLEHNGWLDPDSESDPPEVLPPVDQKCTIDSARDKAMDEEETTYAVALKEARTDAARSVVEAAHTRAVAKIETDFKHQKATRTTPCCFWDSVSQEEVILMIRAINTARGKTLTFLLETKPT